MRSATLRRLIFFIPIIVGAIIFLQLFWLSKQYAFEQKEFTTNVVKGIRGLYEDLDIKTIGTLQSNIEMPNPNTFLVKTPIIPAEQVMYDSLIAELEQVNVFADCYAGVFDKNRKTLLFEKYLPTAATYNFDSKEKLFPAIEKNYSYIFLYFPHRNQYVLQRMTLWLVSGGFLMLVLIAFGACIFYLYKQKFLNEMQSDFIKNVTHEFQTPLTTLQLGLDSFSKPNIAAHPEKIEKYTRLMKSQVDYLKHHIENLSDVTRADSIGIHIKKEKVMPNQLIKAAVHQLHLQIEEKAATVKMELEESNVLIYADSGILFTSVLNVISNSLKYSTNPYITLSTRKENSMYAISVKDNGIGIEEQYIKKLFRKFYRVPTGDTHNVKGLGLGLYFVKKNIEAHRGNVIIHSIAGIGTEFVILLPYL